jgi:hypothetical protein
VLLRRMAPGARRCGPGPNGRRIAPGHPLPAQLGPADARQLGSRLRALEAQEGAKARSRQAVLLDGPGGQQQQQSGEAMGTAAWLRGSCFSWVLVSKSGFASE